MADRILHLPAELSQKLERAALQKAKDPEKFVLGVLEHILEEADSTQTVVSQVRTFGNLKRELEMAGFDSGAGDALLEPMSEEELKDWYDSPTFS